MDQTTKASTGHNVNNSILYPAQFLGISGRRAYFDMNAVVAGRIRDGLRTPHHRSLSTEPLFGVTQVSGKPAVSVPAGLLPVIRLLEWMDGGRPPRGIAAARAGHHPVTPGQFIKTCPHGLIRYHPGRVKPAQLVLEIAQHLPDAPITALATRRADCVGLARFLRRHGVNAYGYVGSGTPYFNDQPLAARVAVSMVAGMAGNPTELEKQDLILCLDAVEASGRTTRKVLLDYTTLSTKLFGLVPMGETPAGADTDWVCALFGFDVLDVLAPGMATRRVEVTTVAAGGRPLARAAASDLELRRYGVWCNDSRNRQAARVARAVAARDVKGLGRLGIGTTHLPGPGRVVVLAENLEHAIRLLPKLKGWALIAGSHYNPAGLGDEERAILLERLQIDPAHTAGLVATPAGLTATTGFMHIKPIPGWAVVIRADAGDGLPPIPDDELAGAADPLLVIDLIDDHHPTLGAFATERRWAYVEAGWWVDGVNPARARVAEFVHRRGHMLPSRVEGGL